LNDAQKAIERYDAGFKGALLITGELNCGKTFFSHYIAENYLKNRDVYTVQPKFEGSVAKIDFLSAIQKATNLRGGYDYIMSRLPLNSVIVIDSMELWWEKSPNGFLVVEQIIKLIEKYCNKVFFVVNVSVHSFELINRIEKIDKHFLNVIECKPFNAEELKDIILFRHDSGGFTFRIKNKRQQNLRTFEFANLFTRYFTYSGGNIGIALLAWVANIEKIEGKELVIKMPKVPDLSAFDKLETDILLLLAQFVLHKRLTLSKINRITMESKEQLTENINYLKRSGLITEGKEGVWEINQFLYVHVKNKLSEINML